MPFYTCLAVFFCFYFSSAQDQISCGSELDFFSVDMDENNGTGSTNSTYEWHVREDEFEGEILPQTSSGNQIIIDWLNTPEGEYTVFVKEINGEASCLPEPQLIQVLFENVFPEQILGPSYVCEGETIPLKHPFLEKGEWTIENENIGRVDQNGNFEAVQTGETIVNFSYMTKACQFTVSKVIQVQPRPKPKLENHEICIDTEGKEIIILNSGLPQENLEFKWYYNDQPMPNSQNHISVTDIGEYKLQVINLNTGCSSDIITTKVKALPKPSISANVDTDFHDNQRIVVNIDNPQAYLFKLEDGEFQDSPVFNNITTEGTYHISIKAKQGCFTKEIKVIVINYPKFFTPNDDGYNDTWNIDSLKDDPTAEIFIFDRYGKLLKMISPSSQKGWDGIYNGKAMPTDDYWFRVDYTDRNDAVQKSFKSNFTLKR